MMFPARGPCPDDIRPGTLGNGWFLSALSVLAEVPPLLVDLFGSNQAGVVSSGKYSVHLCEAGHLETVTIDDLIPCYPKGGPLYAKGHGNELWVMLLEKAYAKMCGSYAALKAGWAFEAMLDLTGAPYWTVRFDDADTKKMIEDGSLWSLMLQNDALNYIQSASTPGEDVLTVGGDRKAKDGETGLVAGHAYALIAVKEVKSKGIKLVQLRNPWGEGGMEWNGDWSDNSPLWTAEIKRELGQADLDTQDGAFWMCYGDFIKYFFSVNACLVRHPDLGTAKWFESRKQMAFAVSAEGEVRAPSYLLTLSEASDKVYFSVHQQDIRNVQAKPYIDFGVTVLQLNASTGKYSLVASSGNSADRQNQTKELSLPAGQYLVIPTSTGCVLRTQTDKKLATTVVVHSTRPHGLVEQAFNAEAYEEAIELPVINLGTVRELEGGLVKLYTRKSGFSGVSYVVQNNHTRDLKFTQDCTVGKNIISSRGALKHTELVPKGEAKVTHHLAPATSVGAWQSGFSASYEWV
jgi:calpain-15